MKAYELINEKDIKEKMWETLELCDCYHPQDDGMDKIYSSWLLAKGMNPIWGEMSVLDILSKHPDYVPGKGYIVKRAEYDRPVDFEVAYEILNDIKSYAFLIKEKVYMYPHSFNEVSNAVHNLKRKLILFSNFKNPSSVTYEGKTYEEVEEEFERWNNKYDKILKDPKICIKDETPYTAESCKNMDAFVQAFDHLLYWLRKMEDKDEIITELLIDENLADQLTGLFNGNIKGFRGGQKFNKVVIKIINHFGFNTKWSSYNRQTARLGDAISPKKYTRFTVISANLVDYWRMSFGWDWSSCHTIDKLHRFGDKGDHYDGMHGSGTESYMLDDPTVIMYTVDKDYEGEDFELQPKINRCMFHLGEGKFIMGRIYPQGKDGEKPVYKQWREIFQTIISECLGITNYWRTEYDMNLKLSQIISKGTHYNDYSCEYCNIAGWSWHKPFADSIFNPKKIVIGHNPICPCCGDSHTVDDNIECDYCSDNGNYETCERCGSSINIDNESYVTNGDGLFWCDLDCAARDGYYLPKDEYDGYVYHERDLYYENSTDTYWVDGYYGVEAPNGYWYHNETALEEDGWEFYEGEVYSEDDMEKDGYTGERFPYHADPDCYYTTDGEYFMSEENMAAYIEEHAA